MNEIQIRYFTRLLGLELADTPQGREWLPGRCPFAAWAHQSGQDTNHSFGVHINTKGKSAYKCFACGNQGSMAKLAFNLGHGRNKDYSKIAHEIEIAEITGLDPLNLPEWDDEETTQNQSRDVPELYEGVYPWAIGHPYLRQRGIHWNTAYALRLRYDSVQQRILFPVYDRRGQFNGFSGRYSGRKPLPAKYPRVRDYLGLPKRKLLLGEHYPRSRSRAGLREPRATIIVEGLFDYARVKQATAGGAYGVLCILGTEITAEKRATLLELDKPLIWMVDNDEAGRKVLYGKIDLKTRTHIHETGMLHLLYGKLPQLLTEYPKRLIRGKDIKDPGDCTDQEIRDMIKDAELFIK